MSEVRAFFTDIKSQIITELIKANMSIYIAVAWFTDSELFDILVSKASSGLKVEIIIVDDETNSNSKINFERLFENGGKVWKIDKGQNTMHNKFCVIDQNIVINGSYNWTNKAVDNHENIMIVSGDENTALNYLNEFSLIKRKFLGTLTEAYLKLSQRLTVLSILLTLKDKEDIIKQGEKIKDLSLFVNKQQYLDLKKIVRLCEQSIYDDANELIVKLIKQTSDFKENSLEDYDTVDDYSDGLAFVSKNGKYGYIDKLGNETIQLQFDAAYKFIDNIARIEFGEDTNFINKSGQLIYDYTCKLNSANWYLVYIDDKIGICNEFGRLIQGIQFSEIEIDSKEYQSTLELKRINMDNQVNLIDVNGNFLFEENLSVSNKCFYESNIIISRIKDDYDNYDYYTEELEIDDFLNNTNKEYGILLENGFFADEWFDSINYDLNKSHLLKVKKNGLWNIVDYLNNNYVFSKWMDEIYYYEKNHAKIYKEKKCNLFDLDELDFVLTEWNNDVKFFDNHHNNFLIEKNRKLNIYNREQRSYLLSDWVDNIQSLGKTIIEVNINSKLNLFHLIKCEHLIPDWVDSIQKIQGSECLFKVILNNKARLINTNNKIYVCEWIGSDEIEVIASRSIRIGTQWFFLSLYK